MIDQDKLRTTLQEILRVEPQSITKLAKEMKIDKRTLSRFVKGEKVLFVQQCKIEKFVFEKQKELNK